MTFELTPMVGLFVLAAATAAAVAAFAARRLDRPGARGLLLLSAGDAVWAAADAVNWATADYAVSRAMLAARYLGIVLVPVALLVFTVAYIGRDEWLTSRTALALSVPSALTVGVVATNPVHGRFYARVAADPAAPKGLAWAYGVAAVPWIAWAYLLVAGSVALLVRYALVSEGVYRWQAVALAVAVSIPTVTDLLFFAVPAFDVNVTPLGVLVGGVVIAAAIYRHDLMALVPATRELGRDELIERMDLGMVLVDADGRIADVNAAAATALSVDADAVVGEPAAATLPDLAPLLDDREGIAGRDGGGRHGEVDLTASVDDQTRRFDVRGEPIGGAGGRGATLVTLRDVTDRHDRRRELERYETVMETLVDPVVVTDADGAIVYANPATEAVTGYDAADVEGMTLAEFVADEDADRLERVLGSLAADGPSRTTVEVAMQTSDGRRFPVEVRFSPLPSDEAFRGVAGVARDVSRRERRKRQLQVLNRVLRHNVRSRMQVVLGNASAAADRADDPAVADLMAEVRDDARALVDLSDEARTLQQRIGGATEQFHDLPALVADRVAGYREAYPSATFEVDVPPDATVLAGPGLGDVLDNLVENAVQHHDRDDPSIAIDAVPDPDHPDEWLRLRVADDGPGIPTVERRIIEGDQEITELQHGSGLGLWTVAWIVRANGGDVTIADNDPRGSVVSCRLRRA